MLPAKLIPYRYIQDVRWAWFLLQKILFINYTKHNNVIYTYFTLFLQQRTNFECFMHLWAFRLLRNNFPAPRHPFSAFRLFKTFQNLTSNLIKWSLFFHLGERWISRNNGRIRQPDLGPFFPMNVTTKLNCKTILLFYFKERNMNFTTKLNCKIVVLLIS